MNNILHNAVVALVVFAAVSLLTHNYTGAAAVTASTAPARHYYLTKGNFTGDHALGVCASGYHFASFAEISDPSVITYNKTLGRTAADEGSGPPSQAPGWIRSGYLSNSNASTSPFEPTNCNVWTSGNSTDHGEGALFDPSAGGNNAAPVVVFGNSLTCDGNGGVGVWCIEN